MQPRPVYIVDLRPPPPDVAGILMGVIGVFGVVAYFLHGILEDYNRYSLIYGLVSWFYYYTFSVPLISLLIVPMWLLETQITSFENLNLVIAIAGSLVYVVFVMYTYLIVFRLLSRMTGNSDSIWDGISVYLSPALLLFFWWILSSVIGWMFA